MSISADDIRFIKLDEWTEEIEKAVSAAAPSMVRFHKRMFEEGNSRLWKIEPHGSYGVTQTIFATDDDAPEGATNLYVVAYAGSHSAESLEALIRIASKQGVHRVVLETPHEGFVRHLSKTLNLEHVTTMYRIDVDNPLKEKAPEPETPKVPDVDLSVLED